MPKLLPVQLFLLAMVLVSRGESTESDVDPPGVSHKGPRIGSDGTVTKYTPLDISAPVGSSGKSDSLRLMIPTVCQHYTSLYCYFYLNFEQKIKYSTAAIAGRVPLSPHSHKPNLKPNTQPIRLPVPSRLRPLLSFSTT